MEQSTGNGHFVLISPHGEDDVPGCAPGRNNAQKRGEPTNTKFNKYTRFQEK